MKKLIVTLCAVVGFVSFTNAQEAAIKWNVLPAGVGAANFGVEFSVAPKWTLSLEGLGVIANPWKNSDNSVYANGWMGTFEARYYTCEAFNGHHLGLYANVGRFGDVTMQSDLLKVFVGATGVGKSNVKAGQLGLSYGYYWKLGHGWGLDAYVGGGIAYAEYNDAGGKDNSGLKFALSRVGLAFSYKF